MQNNSEKIGIIVAIAVTTGALAFVGNMVTNPENISMQSQGEKFLEKTANEITSVPNTFSKSVDNTVDKVEEFTNEIEDVAETIAEIDKIPEIPGEVIDEVDDVLPDVPTVVQQNQGRLIEMIAIPEGTSLPDCEISNTCYIPATSVIQHGGEVIWENLDSAVHTVTSGDVRSGPNSLFDSGMIMPGDTYSVTFEIPNEYDYYCVVHPWMTGKIIVQ